MQVSKELTLQALTFAERVYKNPSGFPTFYVLVGANEPFFTTDIETARQLQFQGEAIFKCERIAGSTRVTFIQ
jgi:hypothetical protein